MRRKENHAERGRVHATPFQIPTFVYTHIGAAAVGAAVAALSDIDTHRERCMLACREVSPS